MTKVNQFNQKLHQLFTGAHDLDMQDIGAAFFGLMLLYKVSYKAPRHLYSEHVEKCDARYRGDVEAMFLDEINTQAHDRFELFNDACHAFLDYSKSDLVETRAKLINLGAAFRKMKSALVVTQTGQLRKGGEGT